MANTFKTLAIVTALGATSAMAYNNNNYGWGMFDNAGVSDANGNTDAGTNWGPFKGVSNWGPFDGGNNWGPFTGVSNFGPFSNDNNWLNDTDFGFNFNTKNKVDNRSTGSVDGKASGYADGYAKGQADARAKGYADGYAKAQADAYAKGYADAQAQGITK